MSAPQYFDSKMIRQKMSMAQCIDAMAFGFEALHDGKAVVPDRTVHEYEVQNCIQLVMPAVLTAFDLLVTKLVTVNPSNAGAELPLIHAFILAQRASTGELLGSFDGSEITSMRTAAASGLATRLFALPESEILGIIGTGNQALYHVESILAVRPIAKVLVRGSSLEKSETFCERINSQYQIDCQPTNTFQDADVICTCTTSTTPVLSLSEIKKGVHINAVGSFRLTDRELDSDIIKSSRVIIDEWAGCEAEAGDIMIPIHEGLIDRNDVSGELGRWSKNASTIQRTEEEITVFKSVGNAVQDAAAVACILGLL